MNDLLKRLNDLAQPWRWVILGVLIFCGVGYGLKVYTKSRLEAASLHEQRAQKFRDEAMEHRRQAALLSDQATKMMAELSRENEKIAAMKDELSKIVVPPKPGPPPANTGQLLSDLQGLGLQLVVKPSMQVRPSIAGITAEDGGKIWTWGHEALRIPSLELQVSKQKSLIEQMDERQKTADAAIDLRTKQADASLQAADAHQKEAEQMKAVAEDLKKAMKAERRKKILYAVGGLVGGYALSRR